MIDAPPLPRAHARADAPPRPLASASPHRLAARRPAALALAFAALSAGGSPACGGGESGSGPANASLFLAQYETTLCGLVASCCNSRGLPNDGAACPEAARATVPAIVLDETKYDYDPDSAAACLGALGSMPGACEPFSQNAFGLGSDFERACGRTFLPRGSAGPGGACTASWQCAAPAERDALSTCSVSNRPGGGYLRICEVFAYADEAGPCDTGPVPRQDANPNITRACKPVGLFCAADGTCKTPAPGLGQPCERGATGSCSGGTFCNGQSLCETPRTAGSPCDDSPDACDAASFCDLASKGCLPRRGEGEPCATETQCQGACTGGICSAPFVDRRDDFSELCASPFSP